MEWRELDLDKRAWTIPRERAKNDRAHEVHLPNLAMEILEALPCIAGSGSTDGAPANTQCMTKEQYRAASAR